MQHNLSLLIILQRSGTSWLKNNACRHPMLGKMGQHMHQPITKESQHQQQ